MLKTKNIKDLSLADLKLESKIMADILNKRLRRLESEGLQSSSMFYTYTLKYAREKKPFIGFTKKKQVKYITGFKQFDRQQMIKIYHSMQKAMRAGTSTIAGTRQANRKKMDSIRKLFEDTQMSLTEQAIIDINDLFKTAREIGFLRTYGSDTVVQMADKGKTIKEVEERVKKINEISKLQRKGQLPNKQVIKAMTLSQEDFVKWANAKEVATYTSGVRKTASEITKEEQEVARISKRLKKI